MGSKKYYVYILANNHRKVLYTGVTNNLHRRLYEHRNGINEGFTKKYNVHYLMHYECFVSILKAIKREKQIKKWYRHQKDALISKNNPEWKDLTGDIY
ncbi:MAG: GIY-YIG nuclease family protein [Bacteroidetes bacterium]|nr:GIY-YIG nuclease family protein [Bacteroidota bacterium]